MSNATSKLRIVDQILLIGSIASLVSFLASAFVIINYNKGLGELGLEKSQTFALAAVTSTSFIFSITAAALSNLEFDFATTPMYIFAVAAATVPMMQAMLATMAMRAEDGNRAVYAQVLVRAVLPETAIIAAFAYLLIGA